jgi:diketogulonate reductase-like aldo/keto reductase
MRSFNVDQLKELLKHAHTKPVVNQILLHPYVIKDTEPLLAYMREHHIVPEGYSTLIPITARPGGPVDKPVAKIAERLGKEPAQILLAWSKAKGWVWCRSRALWRLTASAVIVTTSSKKERLEGYLDVGDIELTKEDVEAIDKAQAQYTKKHFAALALVGAVSFYASHILFNRC